MIGMDLKPRPNHQIYIQTLRRMTPEQRLLRAIELSRNVREVFVAGMRKRFPDLPDEEFRKLCQRRLELCHNRNW